MHHTCILPSCTSGAAGSPAGQKPQSSASQAGRGMAEPVLHHCRKATLTQRHQHTQQNTDLLEYTFPELLPTSLSDENQKCLKIQEGLCTPKSSYQASAKAKKTPVSKMILKRVKSVPSAPQGSSVGAVATGGESRGLTSSESCIPKAAGTVCTENPSSALLLQASCKGASLPPPDLTSFGIKTSGQLHFLSLGSAWEVPG